MFKGILNNGVVFPEYFFDGIDNFSSEFYMESIILFM